MLSLKIMLFSNKQVKIPFKLESDVFENLGASNNFGMSSLHVTKAFVHTAIQTIHQLYIYIEFFRGQSSVHACSISSLLLV